MKEQNSKKKSKTKKRGARGWRARTKTGRLLAGGEDPTAKSVQRTKRKEPITAKKNLEALTSLLDESRTSRVQEKKERERTDTSIKPTFRKA